MFKILSVSYVCLIDIEDLQVEQVGPFEVVYNKTERTVSVNGLFMNVDEMRSISIDDGTEKSDPTYRALESRLSDKLGGNLYMTLQSVAFLIEDLLSHHKLSFTPEEVSVIELLQSTFKDFEIEFHNGYSLRKSDCITKTMRDTWPSIDDGDLLVETPYVYRERMCQVIEQLRQHIHTKTLLKLIESLKQFKRIIIDKKASVTESEDLDASTKELLNENIFKIAETSILTLFVPELVLHFSGSCLAFDSLLVVDEGKRFKRSQKERSSPLTVSGGSEPYTGNSGGNHFVDRSTKRQTSVNLGLADINEADELMERQTVLEASKLKPPVRTESSAIIVSQRQTFCVLL